MTAGVSGRGSRRLMRLKGFDYATEGSYFVTICAWQRHSLFMAPEVISIIEETWRALPDHFREVVPDLFVTMPNHFHAILVLNQPVGSQHAGTLQGITPRPISTIVRSFKSAVTKHLHELDLIRGRVWQSNYYDHVVRNQYELDRIREYVALNPSRWQHDSENPDCSPDPAYYRAWSWLETSLQRD